jgi:hypothetical protein
VTASRWHLASIAGLVVGAMGVFVFTVALRHWLRERTAAESDAQSGSINKRLSTGSGSATA